ncbi:MAG: Ig-like domain-containing protein [Candidatus Promineifilaceae bacterium]
MSVSPAADATGVALDEAVRVTWDQPVAAGVRLALYGPEGLVTGNQILSLRRETLVFRPAASLAPGTTYLVRLEGPAAGRPWTGMEWRFETAAPTAVTLVEFGVGQGLRQAWWWGAWPWLMALLTAMSLLALWRTLRPRGLS